MGPPEITPQPPARSEEITDYLREIQKLARTASDPDTPRNSKASLPAPSTSNKRKLQSDAADAPTAGTSKGPDSTATMPADANKQNPSHSEEGSKAASVMGTGFMKGTHRTCNPSARESDLETPL